MKEKDNSCGSTEDLLFRMLYDELYRKKVKCGQPQHEATVDKIKWFWNHQPIVVLFGFCGHSINNQDFEYVV